MLGRYVDILIAAVGPALARVAVLALRCSNRRIGLAMLFHRVGDPPGDPDREFVPNRGTHLFRSQLRHLQANYQLVAASQLEHSSAARRRGQRIPVAITFDDDLSSHSQVTMPILQSAGIPATFFLCGASLNAPHSFWWENLQVALDRGMLKEIEPRVMVGSHAAATPWSGGESSSVVHRLCALIQEMSPPERDALSDWARHVAPPDVGTSGMSATEVKTLAAAGFEIGFHTRRHDPLTGLADQELAAALTDGREELEQVIGETISVIAYPNGRVDRRVGKAARGAGYKYGFTVVPEPLTPESDPLLLGRIEPSYKSAGHMAVRMARIASSRP